MAKRNYKRKRKLIKTRFQIKVALSGLGIAIVAVLLLMIMINEAILEFASNGWVDAAAMRSEWMSVLVSKLLFALALLVPMTLALGVVLTHKIAGPLYRFEMFLNAVMKGEHPEECRLRDGDELKDFCALLNKVTEPLRSGNVAFDTPPAAATDETMDDADDSTVAEPTVESKVA